ncbi:YheT family hydrolase [Anaeromyxobacter oryzisoli]|uniref:YheT family hydrolase n=1 Tax=Anaeromyxobacter oryzisoli TaxID=2925408 RepID=UPI001F55ECBA|nr:alpha/beta fold hydrolase [Anaeromyxobacter sp. SG63]
MTSYVPARWLPGAHAMTVFASVARPLPRPAARRERWELPDGDFLDLDFLGAPATDAPALVILHGLEGSSRAAYVRGLAALALRAGLAPVALNFRGCSGEPNRLARFYHSGDTGDLDQVVRRLAAARPSRPIALAGFSLGGNVVVKYLGERGDDLPPEVRGGAGISVPFDLARAARALDARGFWNRVYRERFLRRLRQKALEKARRFPSRLDAAAIRCARSFAAFDECVTAPLHGFASAEDYWVTCSARRFLPGVRRPLLLVSATDDPIVPGETVPAEAARANPAVTLVATEAGGHVGFVSGSPLWPRFFAEVRAAAFLAEVVRR